MRRLAAAVWRTLHEPRAQSLVYAAAYAAIVSVAVGILADSKQIKPKRPPGEFLFVGELSLAAGLRPVTGVLPHAVEARRLGKTLVVENAASGLQPLGVSPSGVEVDISPLGGDGAEGGVVPVEGALAEGRDRGIVDQVGEVRNGEGFHLVTSIGEAFRRMT